MVHSTPRRPREARRCAQLEELLEHNTDPMILLVLYVRATRICGLEAAGEEAVVGRDLLVVAVEIETRAHRVLLKVLLDGGAVTGFDEPEPSS